MHKKHISEAMKNKENKPREFVHHEAKKSEEINDSKLIPEACFGKNSLFILEWYEF